MILVETIINNRNRARLTLRGHLFFQTRRSLWVNVTRDEFWSPFDHLSTDRLEKILECTCDIVKSIAI